MVNVAGQQMNALVDTGAEVTVLRWEEFQRLPEAPELRTFTARVKGVGGHLLKTRGWTELPIGLAGSTGEHPVVVIEGMRVPFIVGADLMASRGVVIDMKTGTISSPYRAKVARRTCIPPLSEKCVDILCEAEGEWMIESMSVWAETGIVKADEKGRARINVLNPSNVPLVLSKGEEVGETSSGKFEEVLKPGSSKVTPLKGKRDLWSQVDLSQIPLEHKDKYKELLTKFQDVLSLDSKDVGLVKALPQKIVLKDPTQIAHTPPYRIPHHLRPVAEEYIRTLSKVGVVQKSTSPFNSPLMLVRKAGASPDKPLVEQYRVVHDYRRLNSNTLKDSYPMHNLYELLDAVSQGKVWSVIDLSSGFWNQSLDEGSRPYTAFGLPGMGHWEYTRSAQGLCNSPSAFQRLLDYVVKGLKGVHVYIDDVIISSMSYEENVDTLGKVLGRFRRYGLKCRLSKLQLGTGEVNYLGYNIIRGKGIRAGQAKTEAIRNWQFPKTLTEVKQFLGLCSFFRRTIPDYAATAAPLTSLTKKVSGYEKGELSEEAKESFTQLKGKLVSRPCLAPVDFNREFILTTDASQKGIGVILSQKGADGLERPCAYASRVLTGSEQKWAPTVQEHLAMLWGCRKFKPYLVGKEFVIRTDHKPLTALNRIQGQVLERARAELEEFMPYRVEYLKGEKMPADGLSRAAVPVGEKDEVVNVREMTAMEVPSVFTPEQVLHLQREDKVAKAVVCWAKYDKKPLDPKLREEAEKVKDQTEFAGKLLVRKGEENRLFAPESIRSQLLYLAHDHPLAGHQGTKPTLERLRGSWYWPEMEEEAERYCKGCQICLTVNLPSHRKPAPMGRLPDARGFNERVHADLLGPLPRDQGYRYLLVMRDAYTRWVELIPLQDKTAESVVSGVMGGWISRHGAMKELFTDQGKEFVNQSFQELGRKLAVGHQTTLAYHPQANGLVERTNRSILAYLRKHLEGTNMWVELLPSLLHSLNTTWHSSLNRTPYQMVYGRKPRTTIDPIDVTNDGRYAEDPFGRLFYQHTSLIQSRMKQQEEVWRAQKAAFDKRAKEKVIKEGDTVYLERPHTGNQFQKFQPLYRGPFVVTKILADNVLKLTSREGKHVKAHVNRVKLASFVDQALDQVKERPEEETEEGEAPTRTEPEDDPPDPMLWDEEPEVAGPPIIEERGRPPRERRPRGAERAEPPHTRSKGSPSPPPPPTLTKTGRISRI